MFSFGGTEVQGHPQRAPFAGGTGPWPASVKVKAPKPNPLFNPNAGPSGVLYPRNEPPVHILEQTTKAIGDLVGKLCNTSLNTIKMSLERVTKSMALPPKYDQTDFEAFDVVKIRFEEFENHSSELTAIWEKASQDLRKIQETLLAANDFHKKFDNDVEEIDEAIMTTMNSVRFSTTENLKTLPMVTVNEEEICDLMFFPSTGSFTLSGRFDFENGFGSTHPWGQDDLNRMLCNNNLPDFSGFCSDVDPRYRTNDFLVVRSSGFAERVWSFLARMFSRREIIQTEDGCLWKPKRINEIFKITKLLSGVPIIPPLAGPWKPNEGEASLFSVYICLTDPIPNSTGTDHSKNILVIPHGAPLTFYEFHEGCRFLMQTDVIYEKYDIKTKNPYPLSPHPPLNEGSPFGQQPSDVGFSGKSRYFQIYRTDAGQPEDFMKSLSIQLEEFRQNSKIIPTTIDGKTFCGDIWVALFGYLSIKKIVNLQYVSKDFRETVISQDNYWKRLGASSYPSIQELSFFGQNLTNFQKFKYLSFAFTPKNLIEVVLDIGASQTKYLTLDPRSKKLQLKTAPSLYTFDSGYLSSKAEIGTGFPLKKMDTLAIERVVGPSCGFSDIPIGCVLIDPQEKFPFMTRSLRDGLDIRYLETSVAALCGYNKDSGIVISIGHSKSWLQVVKNHAVVCDQVIERKKKDGQSSGFSFGTPVPSTPSSGLSFSLGSPSNGFSFGSAPPPDPSTIPTFGGTAPPAAPTGYTFGGSSPSGLLPFSFGAPASSIQHLGTPPPSTTGGTFSFGPSPPQNLDPQFVQDAAKIMLGNTPIILQTPSRSGQPSFIPPDDLPGPPSIDIDFKFNPLPSTWLGLQILNPPTPDLVDPEDIKEELKFLLNSYFETFPENNEKLEFCLIGAPFDEVAIKIFLDLLSEHKSNFQEFEIISTIEGRSYAPITGAFFAPRRSLDPACQHLMGTASYDEMGNPTKTKFEKGSWAPTSSYCSTALFTPTTINETDGKAILHHICGNERHSLTHGGKNNCDPNAHLPDVIRWADYQYQESKRKTKNELL